MKSTEVSNAPLVAFGELLIDLAFRGSSIRRSFGGAPANAAILAARLGSPARLIASVGHDELGSFLLERLRREGVETGFIGRVPEPTSIACILMEGTKPSDFIFLRMADTHIKVPLARAAVGVANSVFLFGSLSLSERNCAEALRRTLDYARRRDATIMFDVNWRPRLWNNIGHARRAILHAARGSDSRPAQADGTPSTRLMA